MTRVNYCFYIVTKSGEVVQWAGIAERQAMALYRITRLHKPDQVAKFNWGRIPMADWEANKDQDESIN